jgi:hypothetical protein
VRIVNAADSAARSSSGDKVLKLRTMAILLEQIGGYYAKIATIARHSLRLLTV